MRSLSLFFFRCLSLSGLVLLLHVCFLLAIFLGFCFAFIRLALSFAWTLRSSSRSRQGLQISKWYMEIGIDRISAYFNHFLPLKICM